MHPALSVIVFTTLSGAGYGLLALLGVFVPAGLLPVDRVFGAVALGLAFVLISAGLLSSTLHLGRPERAWRALSQWRSSWLSREGVLSLFSYAPMVLFALGWLLYSAVSGVWAVIGVIMSAAALATVFCTGMIYASLKPIRQWHHPLVAPIYLAFALMTGALWCGAILQVTGSATSWLTALALAATGTAWALKIAYWRSVGRNEAESTPESATGLGGLGTVRLLEAPHTGENYLLTEMAHQIARKHAEKLRRLSLLIGALLPMICTAALFVAVGPLAFVLATVAALSAMAGMLIERWLFFAEAKHSVTLYYGQRAV